MKSAAMEGATEKASALANDSLSIAKEAGKAAYDSARETISDRASSLAADSIAVAREAGKAAYDTARDSVHSAYESAREGAQSAASLAKTKGDVALREVSAAIVARPLTSVAIAGAVGFALAAYLRR